MYSRLLIKRSFTCTIAPKRWLVQRTRYVQKHPLLALHLSRTQAIHSSTRPIAIVTIVITVIASS